MFLFVFSLPSSSVAMLNRGVRTFLFALVGFFFSVIFLPGVMIAQTEIEGEVTGEWNPEGSPYILIGNAGVPEGEQLIIHPGTEIRSDGNFRLSARGQLVIQGTPEDSILFTSNAEDPQDDDWLGVVFSVLIEEEPEISFANFEYARNGIELPFGIIHDCKFFNCETGILGIATDRNLPEIVINNSIFDGSTECGILIFNQARASISYSLFKNNSIGISFFVFGDQPHWVINNTIVNSEFAAIAAGMDNGMINVYNNIIYRSLQDAGFFGDFRNNCVIHIDDEDEEPMIVGEIVGVNDNGFSCDENGNFSEEPGFVGGEPFSYQICPDSPCIDSGFEDLEDDEDGTRRELGAFPVTQTDEFELVMPEGWSMVSFPLWIPANRIDYHIEPNIDMENLILMKDDSGRFWAPGFNFINIPPHNHHKGYLVNMEVEEVLDDLGIFIPANEPIPLEDNWQIVAYYPEREHEAPEAFENITNNLIIAKNDEGRFYAPGFNFNNLPGLHRGKGYLVKMEHDDILIYPKDNDE
ncbi:MAG: right-handed parallel beta-helix repeat-containing protein [Calditrichaeota bacterium]|nr:right-handed parallel beta-helix repeat-containing protein [Calditrichota bacterium]